MRLSSKIGVAVVLRSTIILLFVGYKKTIIESEREDNANMANMANSAHEMIKSLC